MNSQDELGRGVLDLVKAYRDPLSEVAGFLRLSETGQQ